MRSTTARNLARTTLSLPLALILAMPLVGCEMDNMFEGSSANASAANDPVQNPRPESGFGGSASTPGASSSSSRSVRADVSDRFVYVINMRPGPNWRPGLSTADQPGYDRHVDTLRRWSAQGIVVLGGPLINDQGSFVIIRANSLRDAQDLASTDAAVLDGLFRPEVSQMSAQFPGRN